ncbi:glycosyltransferase involved in cell wall biosynthesis [Wenyingzhuangia heitensis]|uniref:Glycosyltransferase involved in cell wall biosynthesis n=1 Tax=Wenyingzhuangia heitensis TaxID=1487859 RepID=A0ABX0UA55_9FLAO|nr:glycosyltransferase family 4 protein [Wenyingzhuangia heitensis]NIJ44695.1 glycosyltransferase involved in cell wall biosynthesis [Wenyingzhuangia heitensis]
MQSLLIIGYVWPEPSATAAGSRMLQIIEQFQLSGYQITFASPALQPELAYDLSLLNIAVKKITLNNSSFDEFVVALNPSIVMFDRFMMEEQFGWRIEKKCPQAIKILDSEDLHFLRKARQQAVKKEKELPVDLINTEDAKRELASIYRCDVTFTISEFEMNYLQEIYKIPTYLLWYFPFLVDVDTSLKPEFKERQDFLFIGNFIHTPNWDAVLQLKQTIWPLIKKQLPKANLHIYGGYPSEKVFQLHNKKDGFLVHGRAEDVNLVMQQAKVSLAPIRFGAGLKGKLIDAMQNKTPFVTSKIGAEGMFGELDFKESVSNSIQDFVAKAVQLYQQKEKWKIAVLKGTKVLEKRFCKHVYRNVFIENLNRLKSDYQAQRIQNFIGSMLQHHTLKSSMYMSKWIEEKNKG